MVRTKCLLLVALAIMQTGCASRGDQHADVSTVRSGWACRALDKAKQDTVRGGGVKGDVERW